MSVHSDNIERGKREGEREGESFVFEECAVAR